MSLFRFFPTFFPPRFSYYSLRIFSFPLLAFNPLTLVWRNFLPPFPPILSSFPPLIFFFPPLPGRAFDPPFSHPLLFKVSLNELSPPPLLKRSLPSRFFLLFLVVLRFFFLSVSSILPFCFSFFLQRVFTRVALFYC